MTVNYPTIGFKPPTAPPKPKDHEEPTVGKPTPHEIGLSILTSIATDGSVAPEHRIAAATALLGY